ncbi:ATP-binding protein [Streptomyces sp. NPDC047525]|uniref:ATP-binding protein n=1 Tax=Streptomyces sp. NPDC047525 TaxID=3155264 RepID=UPI00340A5292
MDDRRGHDGPEMLSRRAAAGGAASAAAVALLLSTQPAIAEDGDTGVGRCAGKPQWVCAGVEVPGDSDQGSAGGGSGGEPAGSTGGGGGGGGGKPTKGCAAGDKFSSTKPRVPCSYDGKKFDEGTKCYYGKPGIQPPKSDPVWKGHDNGAIYLRACMAGDGTLPGMGQTDFYWSATDPLAAAQGPTAEELAQQAISKMRLDGAKIGSAPPAGSKGLVGMPVWMWTARTPNTWGPISTTAAAGGLSVTATAEVKSITWAMGDGTTETCTKPGSPYKKSYGKKKSPDCGHTYSKVPKSGTYKVTATSTWEIQWDATNGETGAVPNETRTADTTINIGELQVVN